MKTTIENLIQDSPLIQISDEPNMASFVLFDEDNMSLDSAQILMDRLPQKIDYVVTVDGKSITIANYLCLLAKLPEPIVISEFVKPNMTNPLTITTASLTSSESNKLLVIDEKDAKNLSGKSVVLIDDVTRTGNVLKCAEKLLKQINCKIVGNIAVMNREEVMP